MIERKPDRFIVKFKYALLEYELSLLKQFINAYGFLIPFGKSVNFKEFAELIEDYYSMLNPRNFFVYNFFMQLQRTENEIQRL